MDSELKTCKFENCKIHEVMFTKAKLDSTAFVSCDLICSSFEDATLDHSSFTHCCMPGSHFLQSKVDDSTINHCNLKNTVFFDAANKFDIDTSSKKTAEITRPIASILIKPFVRMVSTPKAVTKLDRRAGLIPLRISIPDRNVNQAALNIEVASLIDQAAKLESSEPIPQKILNLFFENRSNYPNLDLIIQKSEKLSQVVHSVYLPGGEDIPPALYGAIKDPKTDWDGDYRRSMLEIGIIHYAKSKGIPLMGVCRGFQMANIYYGANLTQNLPGQIDKLQALKAEPAMKSGLLGHFLKNSFISMFFKKAPIIGGSSHHQGIMKGPSEAKEHLETVLSHNGIVKAVQPKESGSSPMILLQFHPELLHAPTAHSAGQHMMDLRWNLFLSSNNDDFWTILHDSSQAYCNKNNMLNEMRAKLRPVD